MYLSVVILVVMVFSLMVCVINIISSQYLQGV
jgi:hypothetical protein